MFIFVDDDETFDDETDDDEAADNRLPIPTPRDIQNMSDEDAMTHLRRLVPENVLAEQLQAVSQPSYLYHSVSTFSTKLGAFEQKALI